MVMLRIVFCTPTSSPMVRQVSGSSPSAREARAPQPKPTTDRAALAIQVAASLQRKKEGRREEKRREQKRREEKNRDERSRARSGGDGGDTTYLSNSAILSAIPDTSAARMKRVPTPLPTVSARFAQCSERVRRYTPASVGRNTSSRDMMMLA
jgi:hypothetical protein